MAQGAPGYRRTPRAAAIGAIGVAAVLLGLLYFLVRGRAQESRADPFAATAVEAGTQFEAAIDERMARALFDLTESSPYLYDPVAYLLPKPGRDRSFRWDEHPGGKLHRRTNNLGFNEDQVTRVEKHGLRVLVSGDSHTAGVVNNAESFCSVAERELRRLLGRADVEVLNAGVGYTSPTCYLGILRKYLALEPDVFVAVLFAGNDFCDETSIGFQARRWPRPTLPADYLPKASAVRDRWNGPFAQGLNQAHRFRHFPGETELSLGAVVECYRAMHALCDEQEIAFLAVMLPTKMDVDEDDRESWSAARDALGLDQADVELNLVLGRRFLELSRAHGIECLDPTQAMRDSRQALYWRRDYHLGIDGHALLGPLLAHEIERLL